MMGEYYTVTLGPALQRELGSSPIGDFAKMKLHDVGQCLAQGWAPGMWSERVGSLGSQGGDGRLPLFLCQGRRNGRSVFELPCTPWSDDFSFLCKAGGEAAREEGVRNCRGRRDTEKV